MRQIVVTNGGSATGGSDLTPRWLAMNGPPRFALRDVLSRQERTTNADRSLLGWAVVITSGCVSFRQKNSRDDARWPSALPAPRAASKFHYVREL